MFIKPLLPFTPPTFTPQCQAVNEFPCCSRRHFTAPVRKGKFHEGSTRWKSLCSHHHQQEITNSCLWNKCVLPKLCGNKELLPGRHGATFIYTSWYIFVPTLFMLRLTNLPKNQEQKWSVISQVTTSQYMRLRPGDHCVCVTAQMFRRSITPWGALQLQAAGQAGSPTAGPLQTHSPLREAHTTYHSVPCFLSASQALLCCCTAGKLKAGSCTQGTRQLEPRQLCRAAMGSCSNGRVKSYRNSLFCHSSSICHRSPCSKNNRQRQDASRRMKWIPLVIQPKWNNSKGDNCYRLSYSLDSFYQNTKTWTNSFTLSLEDMGTPTRVTVLQSMMLRAFWKMHLRDLRPPMQIL